MTKKEDEKVAKRVLTIEANKATINDIADIKNKAKLRVAAYCRVSSSKEEQLNSFEAQVSHYTNFIKSNETWEFAGIYADEGISGKSKEKRTEFMRMIKECEGRKIDMVITKSISRFARNTADCIEVVRKLKALGVAVFFEKENINTMNAESELVLSVLSSIAQEELSSLSQNIRWGNQKRYEKGIVQVNTKRFLGYDVSEERKLIINETEAAIVRRIFKDYIGGKGTGIIARELESDGIKTVTGKTKWSGSAVRNMLANEKYCGDAILQKTYTADTVTFKRKKNRGELPQYYIKDNHEPIISRKEFELVQKIREDRAGKHGNIIGDREKYKNRYPFTYKIVCNNCGRPFKRHIQNSGKSCEVASWGCSTYLDRGSKECNMKPIYEETIKAVFVRMFNKLYTNKDVVLKPFIQNVKRIIDARLEDEGIKNFDKEIEQLLEQERMLLKLKEKGYADEEIYYEEKNKLSKNIAALREQRSKLAWELTGQDEWVDRANKVYEFISGIDNILEEFDEEIFNAIVEKITVKSDKYIIFELKNGLSLDEYFEKQRGRKGKIIFKEGENG